jgi:hypothetical protein
MTMLVDLMAQARAANTSAFLVRALDIPSVW